MNPRILLLHGPNLNFLGRRDPDHYGHITLRQLEAKVSGWAGELGFGLETFQSNHEGALIDKLQADHDHSVGAIVNLGSFTHYAWALYDAILDFHHPTIEVHLSDTSRREPWRHRSVIRPACRDHVGGMGPDGYRVALEKLAVIITGADAH